MGLFESVSGGLNFVGEAIESGVESGLVAVGVDKQTAEKLGDFARLGVDLYTGNWMDIASQADDLADDFHTDTTREGGSPGDMLDTWLQRHDPMVRDHRRRNCGTDMGNYGESGAQRTGSWRDYFLPSGAIPPLGSENKEDWMSYISNASGEEVTDLLASGQIPEKMLENPVVAMALKEKAQKHSEMVKLIGDILDATHQTRKSVDFNV